MKGFGALPPNDENENTFVCVTFAQVEETHRPLIHYDGHFPSANHVIFMSIIGGKGVIIEAYIHSCTCQVFTNIF